MNGYFAQYAEKHIQEQVNHSIVRQNGIKNVYSSINQKYRQMKNLTNVCNLIIQFK
jgi:hypothetical protein